MQNGANFQKKQLSIMEALKQANCQIKDPIAVSYFVFAQASVLVPHSEATLFRACS